MVSMASSDDQWIADTASYIRKAFGNNGKLVSKQEVAALRKELSQRTTPWTIEELAKRYPQPLANRTSWKLTSSHNEKELGKAVDSDITTRWATGKPQAPDMWLQIELPAETEITGFLLDTGKSGGDYPRDYLIQLSTDGPSPGENRCWRAKAMQGPSSIPWPAPPKPSLSAIRQTGSTTGTYWSIHELDVLGAKPAN